MNKKDFKKDAIIKIVVIIAIIVVVNIISNQLFTRIDLTKNQTYTLSPISKTIVEELGDNLVVKAYFSKDLPAPYNNLGREVEDLLGDYRSYSGGNLNYEFVNMSAEDLSDKELQDEAQGYGIQPVQIQVRDKDKFEVKNVYLGLLFLYEGKTEVIPVVQSAQNLEYEITSTIKKITTEKKKKVGYLTGHQEYDLSKAQQLNAILSDQYDLVPVDVSLNKPVPDDVDVLLVLGPKTEIPEAQKYMLDQFVMRGKNVAWLINKIAPNFQQQIVIGEPVTTGLDDMLTSYGIKIDNDLVRDLQSGSAQYRSPIGIPIQVPYPYFPKITDINRENAAFAKLQEVILQFASSIDLSAADGKDVTATPLLKASDKSGTASGFFVLNLEQFDNLTQAAVDTLFDKQGVVLGATYDGKFTSFYNGKTPPVDTNQGASPFNVQHISQSETPSKIIAIGDADFVDESNAQTVGNLIFFINMVDYLADDVGLAEIRSKVLSDAPIEDVSDGTKKFLKYFNLIFPPALVLLIGLYKWNKRKLRKKSLQAD